ncbi:hypothetical protein LR48_Vigan02g204300 [Vigna angularis]|uniref:Uncharacterized protein n=1 Tax=Phaseolus angularis TaxID=3914 RepID=A0A0L9TZ77_PHAAN|nr:hypothetical protein LR48_Vigan02g204300 [Vigna angularis]
MEVCRDDALKKQRWSFAMEVEASCINAVRDFWVLLQVSDAVDDDGETMRVVWVVRDAREVDGGTKALQHRGEKCSGLRRIRVRRQLQGGLMLSNGDTTVDVVKRECGGLSQKR